MFSLKNPNTPKLSSDQDKMHPDDMRNLILFFVIAGVLYFAYDSFILKPQREAIQAHHAQSTKIASGEIPAPVPEKFIERPQALVANMSRVTIENPEVSGSINLQGARFDDLSLRAYYKELDKKENVSVLDPRGMKYFRTVEYGWVSHDKSVAVPDAKTQWSVRGNDKLTEGNPVTIFWNNNQGQIFEQTYSIDAHFMITVKQSVTNSAGQTIHLYPYGLIAQRGMPPKYQGTWVSYEGPVGYVGTELQQVGYSNLRKERKRALEANQGWTGVTDKYWLTTLMPQQGEKTIYTYSFSGSDEKDAEGKGTYQADYMGEARSIAPGAQAEYTSQMFVGAKRVLLLEEYEDNLNIPKFDLAVDFGWFWFMTKPFFYAMHYLGLWTGNMGAAIIILTIILRAAVFPLTNISYRSFAKMKKVGPMVSDLRKQYPDDKQKLQQELIALYQREGVNPMSGCFPMLLQIPIFFALYKTFFVSIELRHAPFFGWIQDLTAPDPTSVFNLFGLIPWDPPSVLHIGVWPCLMLCAMLLQKQLNPPPQDAIQRDMALYMPFMFAYMMSHFAAGLVVYWTFSAYIGVIQQIIIMKSLNVPIHLFGETKKEKELNAQIDKGPAVHPLEKMMEDEVEDALFGKDDGEPPKPISKPKPKKKKK